MDSATIISGLINASALKRAAAVERFDRAKWEIERADIELEAYRKALDAVSGADAIHGQSEEKLDLPKALHSVKFTRTSDSGFGGKWVGIFADLFNHAKQPYSYDDITNAAKRNGNETSIGSLRAQMMKAVNAGLFTRADAGKFEITESGFALISKSLKENESLAGGSEARTGEATNFPGSLNPNFDPPGQ